MFCDGWHPRNAINRQGGAVARPQAAAEFGQKFGCAVARRRAARGTSCPSSSTPNGLGQQRRVRGQWEQNPA
eukprot:scaffold12161_cov69-Phaeocystis_antarctica.AAC.1